MDASQADRSKRLSGAIPAAKRRQSQRRELADQSFSFVHGDFQITVLSDGYISVPGEIVLPDLTDGKRQEMLARLDADAGAVKAKANIPLIRFGNELMLIDIGSGEKYQPSDGRLAENLANAGINSESISKIVFTHAHPDHIWATLMDNETLRFPKATYFVGASEWNFWMDPDYLTSIPETVHEFARGSRRDLGAIKDRVVMLKPGDDVVTGVRALDTAGHTPGHLSMELAGSEGLIIAGDVATNDIVSFEHPDWRFGYDMLPDLAIINRKRLLDRAASDRTKLLGYHWRYPGLGYAERVGNGFRFAKAS